MDLIIDIGNTRAKLAWFQNGRLERLEHMPSDDQALIASAATARVVEAIGIGSVAVDASALASLLAKHAPTHVITSLTAATIQSDYATQATLGADRWANAVASASLFSGRAVLAIDAGTCITHDVVRPDGSYAGGAISPGLGLRARSMHDYSSRLPLVGLAEPEVAPFATTTHDSLMSGVRHGATYECQGFIQEFRLSYPDGVVVLTGGDGLRLSRGLKSGIFAHPFLTLEGYRLILRRICAGLGH